MISLDHNASAPLWPEVRSGLAAALNEPPANPSSVHAAGRAARARLDRARQSIAAHLGCAPREVVFTASGSEAGASALLGAFHGRAERSRTRVVVSAIEHPCVLLAADQLEQEGAQVVRVRPGGDGRVDPRAFAAALEGAAVASLMWVNNETGVVQPVAEVAALARAHGVIFHTDAVQTFGRLKASLRDCPADLVSISGHKLGAPPGIGALILAADTPYAPLVPGHQEAGRRGGTPNVALCEALALALELSQASATVEQARLDRLREDFEREVRQALPATVVNGSGAARAPGTSNLRFEGADGEAVLIGLDLEGIAVASGAACASGSMKPSHVLTAMGLSPAQAQASLRFSYGRGTTADELARTVQALARLVPKSS